MDWRNESPAVWLPHTGDMVMIHQVLDVADKVCCCLTEVDRLVHFRRADGRIPAWAGIEIMAQAAAVHDGIRRHAANLPPQPGFLVSTRSYACHAPFFLPSQHLVTRVEKEFGGDTGMCVLACSIVNQQDANPLVDARINVYAPEEPLEYPTPDSNS